MRRTRKKTRQKAEKARLRFGYFYRLIFKTTVSATALAIILLINYISPATTKPLEDALRNGTDFKKLALSITEHVKTYSNIISEAASVK